MPLLELNEEIQVFSSSSLLGFLDGRSLKRKCMCFQSQTAAVRQGFMLFSELWDFKMLHLITGTEREQMLKMLHLKVGIDLFTIPVSCGNRGTK